MFYYAVKYIIRPVFITGQAVCVNIIIMARFIRTRFMRCRSNVFITSAYLSGAVVYQLPASHYYGGESVVLTLAFMALSGIKNPEQLKLCKPGEIVRLIGLDRIPEMKCYRENAIINSKQKAKYS